MGSNLELLDVEFTKQVLIFGILRGTTERELEQNVRAITGPLTINKIDLVANRSYAVVTFKSSTRKNLFLILIPFQYCKLSQRSRHG